VHVLWYTCNAREASNRATAEPSMPRDDRPDREHWAAGEGGRVMSGVCWKRPETLQQKCPGEAIRERSLPKLDHELAPVPCQAQVPPPFALFNPKETEEPHAMATLGDCDSIQTNLTESSGRPPARASTSTIRVIKKIINKHSSRNEIGRQGPRHLPASPLTPVPPQIQSIVQHSLWWKRDR
jgi:hypothetical protein